MAIDGANRDVTLNVKIVSDPTNAATLARMTAEVEAAKKAMGGPVKIGVSGGSEFANMTVQQQINSMKGVPLDTPLTNKALMGGAASGAAAAGAGGVGWLTYSGLGAGAVGLGLAGGAATIGVAAAAYSAYDTFLGNRNLARSGIGRVGGGVINRGKQFFADVGNFFTTSGDYFDPLGTAKEAKLARRDEQMSRDRRVQELYELRDQRAAENARLGELAIQNRNLDGGQFAGLSAIDRSLYDNRQAQRMANLYGGNQEGLVRAQLDMIGNRAAYSRAPALAGIQNEITSLQSIKNPTTENEKQLADVLERQKRLKMEIAQETYKSLEATRQERIERAQAIREQGMSQQERFGNLDPLQQQEIIDAKARFDRNETTVEDRRLLADYGPQEVKNRLRQQAIDNAVGFPFADEFAGEAKRQENIANEIEISLKDVGKQEFKISMDQDAGGEARVKAIVDAIRQMVKMQNEEDAKKVQQQINVANG